MRKKPSQKLLAKKKHLRVSHKKNQRFIVIALIFLGAVAISYLLYTWYVTSQIKRFEENMDLAMSPSLIPIMMPTSPITSENILPLFKSATFVKKQFDTNAKFFYTYDYPEEVKNIPDEQLIGMKCSYNMYYDGETLTDDKGHKLEKDHFYHLLFNHLDTFSHEKVDNLGYCITEDGREFVVSRYSGRISFDRIKKDGSFENISHIDTYFTSCADLMELTKDGQLYFICSGGESSEHADIYTLDLNAKIIKNIYSCSTDLPGVNPRPPSCESKS